MNTGTSPVVQWLKFCFPGAGSQGSIPAPKRSQVLQLNTYKNKYFLKNHKQQQQQKTQRGYHKLERTEQRKGKLETVMPDS